MLTGFGIEPIVPARRIVASDSFIAANESLRPPTGYWSEAGNNELHLVVRAGDKAIPGSEAVFQTISAPRMPGKVFRATLRLDESLGIDSSNNVGLWLGSTSLPPRLLARSGDAAPTYGDEVLVDPSNQNYLTGRQLENGQVVFSSGLLDNGSRIGIAMWQDIDGTVSRIFTPGDPAPGVDGIQFGAPGSWRVGKEGDLVFLDNVGLWTRSNTGQFELIARTGDTAPGTTDAAFINFNSYDLTAPSVDGFVTFNSTLTRDGSDRGIWSNRSGNGLELVLRTGDPAPGMPDLRLQGGLVDLESTPTGKIAFLAGLSGSDVTNSNNISLWSDGFSDEFEIVVREGDAVPGLPGAVFGRVSNGRSDSFELGDSGQMLFWAEILGPNITGANDGGLWAQDLSGNIVNIVREGDLLDIDDGPGIDFRKVTSVENRGGYRINENGLVAFLASFDDGSTGIFVSSAVAVPEPNASSLALVFLCGIVTYIAPRHLTLNLS